MAGWMRPLLCGAGTWLGAVASLAGVMLGGAKAAATLGFDSVGGGGPFWTAGADGVVEVGSRTVAAGFSMGAVCWAPTGPMLA